MFVLYIQTVIERLKYLNVRRAAVITKLQGTEEEMTDIIDTVSSTDLLESMPVPC
jgi:hypothetical protein